MTERRVLLAWGAACMLCGLIVDHRAVVATGLLANQEVKR